MPARLGRAPALGCLLIGPAVTWAADPTADEGQTLDVRRLSSEQRRRLLAGETISYSVPQTNDVQAATGGAMYLPVPLARAAEVLTSPEMVLRDSNITASGPIPADATPQNLRGFTLAGEAGGGQGGLGAPAGARVNL